MKKLNWITSIIFFGTVSCLDAAIHEMFPQEDTRGGRAAMAPQAAAPGMGAVRSRIVPQARRSALPAVAEQAAYPFFADAVFTTTVSRVSHGFGGAEIVKGETEDKSVSSFTVYTPEGTRHEIHDTQNGLVYVAVSLPDGTMAMQQFNPSLEPSYCGNDALGHLDAGAHPGENDPPDGTGPEGDARLTALTAVATTTVDLMMVFDTTATTWADNNAGGVSAMANSAVARMNVALENSNIGCTIQLVSIYQPAHAVAYSAATAETSFRNALNDITDGYSGFSGVADQRTACGADVVSLMFDTGDIFGITGFAWLESHRGIAFSACSVRSANISHVMTHEIGHNFGCGHSKRQNGSNEGSVSYAAGSHFAGKNGKNYHTIMAYNSNNNTYYDPCNLFSSPELTWQGTPTGVADDTDNARRIRERMGTVAGFNSAKKVVVTFVSPSRLDSQVYDINEPYGTFPDTIPGSFPYWYTMPNGGGTQVVEGNLASASITTLYFYSPIIALPVYYACYVDALNGRDENSGLSQDPKATIQAALDTAKSKNMSAVIVAAGVYAPFTASAFTNRITILSASGAALTIIDGGGTQRCATAGAAITDTHVTLDGFTLRNGYTTGDGGGTLYGTVNNCVYTNNRANNGGGSAYGRITGCLFAGNTATGNGGGTYRGEIARSTFIGNTATSNGGGSWNSAVGNSLYLRNRALNGGGAHSSALTNCTLSGNNASASLGNGGGGICSSTARNCIIWGNISSGPMSATFSNYYPSESITTSISYSCTSPLPPNNSSNLGVDPLFADADYRISQASPCKNAGQNSDVTSMQDLKGNRRIQDTVVDMGAYELPVPVATYTTPAPVPYSWLDGYYSAATPVGYELIANGTGANGIPVWQSYVACLNPTNPGSRFAITGLTFTNGVPYITCDPYRPDIRNYETVGGATLDNAGSWGAASPASRFFRMKVLLK